MGDDVRESCSVEVDREVLGGSADDFVTSGESGSALKKWQGGSVQQHMHMDATRHVQGDAATSELGAPGDTLHSAGECAHTDRTAEDKVACILATKFYHISLM